MELQESETRRCSGTPRRMISRTRLQLLLWRVEDNLRYSRIVRSLAAWLIWLRGSLSYRIENRIRDFSKALGLAERPAEVSRMLRATRSVLIPVHEPVWRRLVETTPLYVSIIQDRSQLTRSVILKAPGGGGEKGVLLNYFEYNLARVLALSDEKLDWLERNFHLIFVASWSPTDYALLGSAFLRWRSPIFVQCANESERAKLEGFHPRLICLPGLACDWVDPSFYHPKPFPSRSIDLLMVANWGAFKRHWEFFEALTRLPASLRVVLVGQREGGRDKKFIEQMAHDIRVPQTLEFYESLSIDEVTAMQCDARVSVILSRREGGCVAAVESLFADCALAMRADAHIGSSAHIHELTGRKLRPGHMAEDLAGLLAASGSLKSREWASAHIRNDLTLIRINGVVRDTALAAGEGWTRDLAVPRWRPHPTLMNEEDRERLRPVYADLHERFPALLSPDLMDTSHG